MQTYMTDQLLKNEATCLILWFIVYKKFQIGMDVMGSIPSGDGIVKCFFKNSGIFYSY